MLERAMAFTLRQLQYFVAVAEQGSVTRAAQNLSISQSSVTEAIKELEGDLGVELFERHPRGLTMLHPIAAGDMYGVKGIDHIARDGLIDTVIAGSYPSGPSNLPMPAIWAMIEQNRIAANDRQSLDGFGERVALLRL